MQFSTLVTHPFQLRRPDSALSERSDDRTVVPCKNARCSPGVGQRDLSHSIADVSRLERPRRRSNQYCACRANGCMASAGFYWAFGNVIPKRVTPRPAKISLFSRLLAPRSICRRFRQPFANLRTIDAEVLQVPVAETAQNEQLRSMLPVSDHGIDPAIEPVGKPGKIESQRFSRCDRDRGIAGGMVEHRHGRSFSKVSPLSGCNMRLVASEDFQRRAIYRLD